MINEEPFDGQAVADHLRLRYVGEDEPGIRRVRRGTGWSYHSHDGVVLKDAARERCVALVVPPAWTEVWICGTPDGHLQARGSDEAGRTQYLYHQRWTDGRRLMNFDRFRDIGPRLGPIRKRLDRMMADEERPRQRALAAMIGLVDRGAARIGGVRSAREFGHFGVSTLRADHVEVDGDVVTLAYPGKAGVEREVSVTDSRLADVIADLDSAGERIFRLRDADGVHELRAADANALLDEITRTPITCKDFRTWGGSAVALEAMIDGADDVAAVDAAAEVLGNTRAVARGSYVHPHVLTTPAVQLQEAWAGSRNSTWYDRRERALLKLLEAAPPLVDDWLAQQASS